MTIESCEGADAIGDDRQIEGRPLSARVLSEKEAGGEFGEDRAGRPGRGNERSRHGAGSRRSGDFLPFVLGKPHDSSVFPAIESGGVDQAGGGPKRGEPTVAEA